MPLKLFYEVWTLKEAALKANGKGLFSSLKDIEIYDNYLICCNEVWNFKKLEINDDYISHIVFKGNPSVELNEITNFD